MLYISPTHLSYMNIFRNSNPTWIIAALIFTCLAYFVKKSFQPSISKEAQVAILNANDLSSDSRLLLGIVGHVFDVSEGKGFYGPGRGYAGLVGKDCSRFYATGEFSVDGNEDNMDDFGPEQCRAVSEWLDFYQNHKSYKFVGLLKGLYFNSDGSSTSAYQKFQICIDKAKENDDISKSFVLCNNIWSELEGSVVWCSDGFTPRKAFPSSGSQSNKSKCVCAKVHDDGSVQEAVVGFNLVEYEGCLPEVSTDATGSITEEDNSENRSPASKNYLTKCNLKSSTT